MISRRVFTFHLLTIIAMMVGMNAKATVTITEAGGIVTVNSDGAGQLAAKLASLTTEETTALAATTIRFVGQFNTADLEALSARGYFTASTVDMSEAQFKRVQSSGNYKLFSTKAARDASTGNNNGDRCIVGGTWYRSVPGSSTYSWTPITEAEWDSSSSKETPTSWSERERASQTPVDGHDYKVMVAEYYKKYKEWIEVTSDSIDHEAAAEGVPATHVANNYEKKDWTEENLNDHTGNHGDKIKIVTGWNYYQKVSDGAEGYMWEPVGSSAGDFTESSYDNQYRDNHIGEYGNDSYVKFPTYKYYIRKNRWGLIATGEVPSDATVHYDWGSSPSVLADHLADDSEYAGFPTSTYHYYHTTENTSFNWQAEPSYSEGQTADYRYETAALMGTPGSAGLSAVVGGTEYMYDGTNSAWVEPSSVTYEDDYSQMKFSYWGENITTAVTSKYADNTISNQLFNGCTNLATVDYMAGNVTGFADRNNGVSLSVAIHKDVTRFESNAFKDCMDLTSITFPISDYDGVSDLKPSGTYPKDLTIGDKAFFQCSNLQGITIPNRTTTIGDDAFKSAGNSSATGTFDLQFERRLKEDAPTVGVSYTTNLAIGNGTFEDCRNIKSLSLPVRLASMGTRAFAGTTGMTTLEMRETTTDGFGGQLSTIPNSAFERSGVTHVTIPKCVTLIESGAFQQCNNITEVVFQMSETATPENPDAPLIIKTGAFAGGGEEEYELENVYVDINPACRKLVCEYNAFNFTSMMGQTAEGESSAATLTFNEAYWDYYAGDWKKGLAFTQENLNGLKDGYTGGDGKYIGMAPDASSIDKTTSTTGKYETGSDETEYSPANGWQQFAHSNTGIDVILPKGKFIRSYSTAVPLEIPYIANTTTPLVRIFRITGFSDGYTSGDINDQAAANSAPRTATATEITGGYIPANTGLIMVGYGDDESYLLYLKEKTGDGLAEYPWTGAAWDGSAEARNLLVPSNNESPAATVTLNPTDPYPYGSQSNIQYRIFVFKKNETQDGGNFQRIKPGVKMTAGHSYMKLPVSLFHWGNEGASGNDVDGTSASAGKAISMVFSDDLNDDEGSTTGISINIQKKTATDNGCYYTLQGVKVAEPLRKGIYIRGGKKTLVK